VKIGEGREQDEGHVIVRFLGMDKEEWRDRTRLYYGGKPKNLPGKVILKWGDGRPEGTPFHQEWSSEMVTELGFSLLRDPWGELHWLPPRDDNGDIEYGFRREILGA